MNSSNKAQIYLMPRSEKAKKEILKKRFTAFALDIFSVVLLTKVLLFTFGQFFRMHFSNLPFETQTNVVSNLHQIQWIVLSITFWGYFVLSNFLSNGKTIGKSFSGLRVFSPSEEHLTFQESFMRTFGYFFGYATGSILLAIPFMRQDAKGLPDWFSSTYVITEDEYAVFLEETFSTSSESLETEEFEQTDFLHHLDETNQEDEAA